GAAPGHLVGRLVSRPTVPRPRRTVDDVPYRRHRPVGEATRGLVHDTVTRVRQRGRAAVLRSLRLTSAAVAAYLVASLFSSHEQPLLAPLTALLVVQVTLFSTLTSGIERVVSVVAGVLLAVLFA